MNKIFNIIRELLMIIVVVLYFVFSIFNTQNFWICIVNLIFSAIFIVTTLIDILKKRTISLERNILQIIFISILLIFLLRPFFDTKIFLYLNFSFDTAFRYGATIFEKNQLIITFMIMLLFINNYIEYQSFSNKEK